MIKNIKKAVTEYWYVIVWVVLLSVVSVSLMLNNSVWLDEAYSMNWTSYAWGDMMQRLIVDVHPPLFYILLKIAKIFTPHSLVAAKIFIIVGFALTLGSGAIVLKKRCGIGAMFTYTLFLFSIPMIPIKTVEIRMYTWGMAFTVLSAIFMYKLMEQEKKEVIDWICFVVFSLCAAYTHYYALLCMVFLYPLLLIFFAIKKDYRSVKSWIIAAVATVIGYLPWLPIALRQIAAVNGDYWIEEKGIVAYLKDIFRHELFPHSTKVYLLILAASGIWLLYKFIKKKDAKHYMGLTCIVPFFGILAFGVIYGKLVRPIMVDRYLIFAVTLLAVGVAISVSDWKWYVTLLVCIFCAAMLIINYPLAYDREYNTNTDATLKYIEEEGFADGVIVTNEACLVSVVSYYYPECDSRMFDGIADIPAEAENVLFLNTKDFVEQNMELFEDYSIEICPGYGLDNTDFEIVVLERK